MPWNAGRSSSSYSADHAMGQTRVVTTMVPIWCALKSCSTTGDLAGIGSRVQPAQLQTRMLYPRGGRGGGPVGTQAKPTTATVTPRTGAAVSGTLEFMDDFTVGLRDADGYYRAFSRDSVK